MLVGRITRIVIGLGGAATAGVFTYAPEIIDVLAGPEYESAVIQLRILSLAVLVNFVAPVFTYTALALNQQMRLVWLYGCLAPFNVVANLALIPRYSYVGAAWVTVFTDTAVVVGGVLICRRSYPLRIDWTTQVSALVGVSLAAAVAWGISRFNVPLSMLALIAGIGLLSERMKVLTWVDLRSILGQQPFLQRDRKPQDFQ